MAVQGTGTFLKPDESARMDAQVEALMTNYSNDSLNSVQTMIYQLAVNIHGLTDNGLGYYWYRSSTGEILYGD